MSKEEFDSKFNEIQKIAEIKFDPDDLDKLLEIVDVVNMFYVNLIKLLGRGENVHRYSLEQLEAISESLVKRLTKFDILADKYIDLCKEANERYSVALDQFLKGGDNDD